MKKILTFIYNEMADFELTFPATTAGSWFEKEIITIAYEKEVIKGSSGIQYFPHMTVKEALNLTDVDGIIIPGGWCDELSEELKSLLIKLNDEKKMIAAICAAPLILARVGILDDKQFTTALTKDSFKSEWEK